MYSSNQIIKVSCDERQLKFAIKFFFQMKGVDEWKQRKISYQIIPGGKIAIGWYFDEPPTGWQRFPVSDPSVDLLAATISDYLKAFPAKSSYTGDGSTKVGFYLETIEDWTYEQTSDIYCDDYTIFVASSYSNYYAK